MPTATRSRRIVVRIRRGRPTELTSPVGTAPQSIRIVDGVSGLVSHDAQAPLPAAALDIAHDVALQLPQARVRKIEGNCKTRNTVWRKPFGGQPDVRSKCETASLQLAVQALHFGPREAVAQTKAQTAEAQIKQRGIIIVRPAVVGQLSAGR